MSVVIESPLSSQVFGPMPDTLSPPPTPVAKRSRHFFPSEASTPTPMFFPKNKSLLSGRSRDSSLSSASSLSPSEKENAEQKRQLQSLASRPAPALHLRPRPTDVTNQTARLRLSPLHRSSPPSFGPGPLVKRKITAEQVAQIPALPFVFAEEETPKKAQEKPAVDAASIPGLPSMSSSVSSSRSGSPVAPSAVKRTVPLVVKRASVSQSQQAKLPSFQRGGMKSVVSRRNSFVARSA